MLSAYCWPHSGTAGTSFPLSASSDLGPVHVTVTRVGAERTVMARHEHVEVGDDPVPEDAVANGCRWPVAIDLPTGHDWPSGFYEVALLVNLDGINAAVLAFITKSGECVLEALGEHLHPRRGRV